MCAQALMSHSYRTHSLLHARENNGRSGQQKAELRLHMLCQRADRFPDDAAEDMEDSAVAFGVDSKHADSMSGMRGYDYARS